MAFWRSAGKFSRRQALHVEGVNGRTLFGADARRGNVQLQLGQCLRNRVKQADAVFGFDFNQRACVRRFVVKDGLRWYAFAQYA